jgi:hypothetical protein
VDLPVPITERTIKHIEQTISDIFAARREYDVHEAAHLVNHTKRHDFPEISHNSTELV